MDRTATSASRSMSGEMGKVHRQWLADLGSFKNSLRAQGVEPKAIEYVNEAFGRITECIKMLAS